MNKNEIGYLHSLMTAYSRTVIGNYYKQYQYDGSDADRKKIVEEIKDFFKGHPSAINEPIEMSNGKQVYSALHFATVTPELLRAAYQNGFNKESQLLNECMKDVVDMRYRVARDLEMEEGLQKAKENVIALLGIIEENGREPLSPESFLKSIRYSEDYDYIINYFMDKLPSNISHDTVNELFNKYLMNATKITDQMIEKYKNWGASMSNAMEMRSKCSCANPADFKVLLDHGAPLKKENYRGMRPHWINNRDVQRMYLKQEMMQQKGTNLFDRLQNLTWLSKIDRDDALMAYKYFEQWKREGLDLNQKDQSGGNAAHYFADVAFKNFSLGSNLLIQIAPLVDCKAKDNLERTPIEKMEQGLESYIVGFEEPIHNFNFHSLINLAKNGFNMDGGEMIKLSAFNLAMDMYSKDYSSMTDQKYRDQYCDVAIARGEIKDETIFYAKQLGYDMNRFVQNVANSEKAMANINIETLAKFYAANVEPENRFGIINSDVVEAFEKMGVSNIQQLRLDFEREGADPFLIDFIKENPEVMKLSNFQQASISSDLKNRLDKTYRTETIIPEYSDKEYDMMHGYRDE